MVSYNCIIIDDVEIDRLLVYSYVKKHPMFTILGVFDSSEAAFEVLEKEKIDIAFLDIDMPEESGLQLRKRTLNISVCVFITSHPEYALNGFELDALDYIIKPLDYNRFLITVKRIEEYLDLKSKASLYEATIADNIITIKESYTVTKVNLKDILYLEALNNYTIIVTKEMKHRVLLNIGSMLKDINFEHFVRIHRGFAVQKHFVQKTTSQEIFLSNTLSIPVGRNYKENLKMLL